MSDTRISRRAALLGAGAVAAWLASPARPLLAQAARWDVPASVDALIAKMTLEEKDALWAQGTSQTLAFMAKRLAKEREESVDGALPGKVGEDGTGL